MATATTFSVLKPMLRDSYSSKKLKKPKLPKIPDYKGPKIVRPGGN